MGTIERQKRRGRPPRKPQSVSSDEEMRAAVDKLLTPEPVTAEAVAEVPPGRTEPDPRVVNLPIAGGGRMADLDDIRAYH